MNDTWGKKVVAQVGGRMRPIESRAEVPHAKLTTGGTRDDAIVYALSSFSPQQYIRHLKPFSKCLCYQGRIEGGILFTIRTIKAFL